MGTPPTTRPSLLVRLRDARDKESWRDFVGIYAPLVYGFARRRGLQDADAADVTQDVLRAVAQAVDRLDYDPEKGSFHSWLFKVAHRKLLDHQAGQRRCCRGTGDSAVQELLEEQPAPAEDQSRWDAEYEHRLFTWAAGHVRGRFTTATWQAFWDTAVAGKPAREVADALGLSVGAVYIAKSRVQARLREEIQRLQGE
jgi:RNA polymerase sigma-70 factor (ECF subfamily)